MTVKSCLSDDDIVRDKPIRCISFLEGGASGGPLALPSQLAVGTDDQVLMLTSVQGEAHVALLVPHLTYRETLGRWKWDWKYLRDPNDLLVAVFFLAAGDLFVAYRRTGFR